MPIFKHFSTTTGTTDYHGQEFSLQEFSQIYENMYKSKLLPAVLQETVEKIMERGDKDNV